MAYSRCAKCAATNFQLVEKEISGAIYKMNFIQCSSCGTVVGVTGYYDTATLIKRQEKEIADLKHQVSIIDHNLRLLINNVSR